MKKKKISNYSIEEIEEFVKNSYSAAETCRKIGLSHKSGNTSRLKKYLTTLNIDFSHWTGKLWSKGSTVLTDARVSKKTKLEEVFIENSLISGSYVRKLILTNNLLEYKCSLCGLLPFWNNKELNFQLDHINGIRNDHRIENLRWLCPNCHSQTDTYCGKNINKGLKKVSDEEILSCYEKCGNIHKTLDELKLAGSGNIKRIKKSVLC